MKKLLGILVLGFVLTGCATTKSIDHVKQKELIGYESIKLGMNFQDLVLMLGEGGQRIYYYKDGKEKDLIAAVPRIKGVYGWDLLGKSYFYIGEGSKGSKQHPSNFTLVYFSMDIGVANKYLIDRLKEGKEKEKEVKDYEKYTKDYRYISWHEKWKKKQKKIDKKSKKKKEAKKKEEEQLAKEKKEKEEEEKKEEDQLAKEKKDKEEEKIEKKEADDYWF